MTIVEEQARRLPWNSYSQIGDPFITDLSLRFFCSPFHRVNPKHKGQTPSFILNSFDNLARPAPWQLPRAFMTYLHSNSGYALPGMRDSNYLKAYFLAFLLLRVGDSNAQMEFFVEAIKGYANASARLLPHEEIGLTWKMDGKMQVFLNEGINSLLENNPSLAKTNFSQIVQQDSSIWEAYYLRSVCHKQLGAYADAEKDIHHVIKSNHAVYEGYIELGKINLLGKDVKIAEKNFDKAIRTDPERPAAYYFKGNIQLEANQPRDAARHFRDCLKYDSLFLDARIKLAIIDIFEQNNLEAGVPQLNRVLMIDSLNKPALLFHSIATFTVNKEKSLADLNSLVRVNPTNLMALYLRGYQLSACGNYARAFPDFHKVIEATSASENSFVGHQTWLDKKIDVQNAGAYVVTRVYGLPDRDALKIKKAYCLLVMGAYDQSIYAINETSIAKKEPLCLFLKGVASEHSGDHGRAMNYYEQALRLDNDILDAHKKRGIYEQELKEWKKSIADFTEVLRINPEAFVVYKMRGVSYFYENMLGNAIEDFSRYLQRDSLNKEIIAYRAVAYNADGQILNAALDFANSDHTDMLNYKQISGLIDEMLQRGDSLNTLIYLNKFTKCLPQFTEGFVLRIRLLVARNDWATIADVIDTAIRNSRAYINRKDHSYLLTIKGMALSKEQNYGAAVQKLDEAITYDKSNSLAFLERGKALLASGKTSKAIIDLKKAASTGYKEADELLKRINI